MGLVGTTPLDQIETESSEIERVLHNLQNSKVAASPSDAVWYHTQKILFLVMGKIFPFYKGYS